jgi:hypothetical protein
MSCMYVGSLPNRHKMKIDFGTSFILMQFLNI